MAIDSVATGRIPSLFCAKSVLKAYKTMFGKTHNEGCSDEYVLVLKRDERVASVA